MVRNKGNGKKMIYNEGRKIEINYNQVSINVDHFRTSKNPTYKTKPVKLSVESLMLYSCKRVDKYLWKNKQREIITKDPSQTAKCGIWQDDGLSFYSSSVTKKWAIGKDIIELLV